MTFLIVGFGAMGCRHAQSIISAFPDSNIYVLEPNEEIFKSGIVKINTDENKVKRIIHLNELNFVADYCVIATSAQPRFDIFKTLVEKRIKCFLLEKVVFQSEQQFIEATQLISKYQVSTFCNFVSRYYYRYQEIKGYLKSQENSKITYHVYGGDFGLACNALHYFDMFEYLTDSKINIHSSLIEENKIDNRRGNQYKEVVGYLHGQNSKGDTFYISSEKNHSGGIVISIKSNNSLFQLNESTQTFIHFKDGEIEEGEFELIPTSKLTGKIFKDIMNGVCVLPSVEQTSSAHIQLFNQINPALGLTNHIQTLSPIT